MRFKLAPQVVFAEPAPDAGNMVRFRLSPDVAITLDARAKRPGEAMTGRPVSLTFTEAPAQGGHGRMEAYEGLLGDTMIGDATLFARQDVVEPAQAIVDPVIREPSNILEYDPGTWGPKEADSLVSEIGGWNTPR